MSLLNQPKQPLESYGLYRDEDSIAWLLQQGTSENAIGVSNRSCPFRIKTHLKLCTHKFDLNVNLSGNMTLREYEFLLPNSEALKAFDPVILLKRKDTKTLYFESSNFNSMVKAQQVLNPVNNYAISAKLAKEYIGKISKRLESSNLSSFVIYGLQPEHLKLVETLGQLGLVSPGRLVLVGDRMALYNSKDLIDVVKLDDRTSLFLKSATTDQLRQIGSYRLKKHMRS